MCVMGPWQANPIGSGAIVGKVCMLGSSSWINSKNMLSSCAFQAHRSRVIFNCRAT